MKTTGAEVVTLPSNGQNDTRTYMANTSQDQIAQLTLKFQLAHSAVSKISSWWQSKIPDQESRGTRECWC